MAASTPSPPGTSTRPARPTRWVREAQAGGPEDGAAATLCLQEVLEGWGLPERLTRSMSPRWRCRLAVHADGPEAVAACVVAGEPCTVGPPRAVEEAGAATDQATPAPTPPPTSTQPASPSPYTARVFEGCGGKDGLAFLCEGPWNPFAKPRIAFVGGWGAPGMATVDDQHFKLVRCFRDVLGGATRTGPILNLQLFHRGRSEGGAGGDAAGDAAGGGVKGADSGDGGARAPIPNLPAALEWPSPEFFGQGAATVVDMATRVSRRGALTWWHLDDGGEFVFQVGLPLSEASYDGPMLMGPSNGRRAVVKLFFFLPKDGYGLVAQDDETNRTQHVAGLDLFTTPSEHLPPVDAATGFDPLPVVVLAPLEAGGPPLLSPPNVPHCVLTLQSCVMVEQRRISTLFLDEVAYFLARCEHWADPPILYRFIKTDMRTDTVAANRVADRLMAVLAAGGGGLVLARAQQSLQTMLDGPKHFALDAPQRSRVQAALQANRSRLGPDPRARLHAQSMAMLRQQVPGVTRLSTGHFCAHAHVQGRPRWGPLRAKAKLAREDRELMVDAARGLGGGRPADPAAVARLDTLIGTLRRDAQAAASGGGGGGGDGGGGGGAVVAGGAVLAPAEDLDDLFD